MFQSTNASTVRENLNMGLKADRIYMKEQLIPHLDYIEDRGIKELQSFIQLLHDYGCRTDNQRKIIDNFIVFIKETKKVDIFLLKARELKKANAGERNILMNRLAIEYPEDFVSFIKEFLYQNFPQKPNTEDYVQGIQEMVKQLTNPVSSALISQVTSPVINDHSQVTSQDSVGFVDENPLNSFFDQSEVFTEFFSETCDLYFNGMSIMQDSRFNI